MLPLLASIAAAQCAPFTIPSIATHQPNGYNGGQLNYCTTAFTVNPTNGGSLKSAYCNALWGDVEANPKVTYSPGMPTGQSLQCASSLSNKGDKNSEFSFQLYSYTSTRNYSVLV